MDFVIVSAAFTVHFLDLNNVRPRKTREMRRVRMDSGGVQMENRAHCYMLLLYKHHTY